MQTENWQIFNPQTSRRLFEVKKPSWRSLSPRFFLLTNSSKSKYLSFHPQQMLRYPARICNKAGTIIIGHEHPAVCLRKGARQEKFKCFLKGKYKKNKLIVMPSFCLTAQGTDIQKEKLLSPYLHQKLDNFEVFVVGDKIYDFGKLKNLK